MMWLRYSIRSLRKTRVQAVCTALTIVVAGLLILVLLVTSRLLGAGGRHTSAQTLLVTSRAAPLFTPLPARIEEQLKQIAKTDQVSPLALLAVNVKGNKIPRALIAVDTRNYLAMNASTLVVDGLDSGNKLPAGKAIVGEALAREQHLKLGDPIILTIVKTLIPINQSELPFTVGGFLRDTAGKTGEHQILVEFDRFSENYEIAQGTASAFLVAVANGQSLDPLAHAIDSQMATSSNPTLSGDESVVVSGLMSRFADIQSVARGVAIIATIVFLVVLVSAAIEMLNRDMHDRGIFEKIGFRPSFNTGLSFLKWNLLAIGALVLATWQLGIAVALLSYKFPDLHKVIPTLSEGGIALLGSIGLAQISFCIALMAFGVARRPN